MKESFASKLVCPMDKGELNLQVFVKDKDHHIIEGLFTCNHCKRYYPVMYRVPVFLPDEYREKQLELPVIKRWEK